MPLAALICGLAVGYAPSALVGARPMHTAAEQEELMVKMTEARAAEVLPREALEEVPMTHFEYSR